MYYDCSTLVMMSDRVSRIATANKMRARVGIAGMGGGRFSRAGQAPPLLYYGFYPHFVYSGGGFAPLLLLNIHCYKERFLCRQRRS